MDSEETLAFLSEVSPAVSPSRTGRERKRKRRSRTWSADDDALLKQYVLDEFINPETGEIQMPGVWSRISMKLNDNSTGSGGVLYVKAVGKFRNIPADGIVRVGIKDLAVFDGGQITVIIARFKPTYSVALRMDTVVTVPLLGNPAKI